MKRILAWSLMVGVLSVGAFVGCGDTSSVKTEKKVTGPGGTTKTTTETTVEKTGDNPPPP